MPPWIFLMLLLFTISSGAYHQSNSNAPETYVKSAAVLKWVAADKLLREVSAMAVKNILPHALQASETLNLTSGCSRGMLQFLVGVKQTKLWAFKMLDSFGKIPNGMLNGGISALGDYDECVNVKIPKGNARGRYCTVELMPPLPPRERFVSYDVMIPQFVNITAPDSVTTQVLKIARSFYHMGLRTSICVPSVCSQNDVEQIASKVAESMKLEFEVTVPNCETKVDKVVFTSTETAIIAVLSILLLVAIVATLVDVTLKLASSKETRENLNLPTQCLLCFSMHRNLKKLLKKDRSPDSIKIFHGMKAIAMIWVIFIHTYLFINYHAMSASLEIKVMTADFLLQFLMNGFLSVQVFFFISAVLSAYGVMKMKQKNLNVFMFIFRRFWRLTPPFMLVIACVFIIPHLGSGPVWKETVVDQLTENCRKYWWTNLIYVNNFVSIFDMCLRWTWYVPVDTQLYIVSLVVLVPLKRNARLGFIMNALLFSIAIITSAVLHVHYKLHPTTIPKFDHPDDIAYASDYGYHRPYLHCGTYCIGLTVGYILVTKPKIRIPMWVNTLGWIVALALAIVAVYGPYDWMQGHLPSMAVSTLYATTHRSLFSLALAWMTISCMNGSGGIVTSFLSWDGFVPLGRLTYMTYLVHPLVIYMYFGSARNLIRLEHRTMVFLFLGVVMMSFMCSLALGLLFESPFMALERLLVSSGRRTAPSDVDKMKREDCSGTANEKKLRWSENGDPETNGNCIASVTKL